MSSEMVAMRVRAQLEELKNPDSDVWSAAAAVKVALVPAPVVMQPSKYVQAKWKDGDFGRTSEVFCQALHNGKDIAFRLKWAAPKPKDRRVENDDFPDSAALLFPLSAQASLIMGSENAPVNMWHWRADLPKAARSNIATGIGTSRVVEEGAIGVGARHHDGFWHVVFARALAGDKESIGFAPGGNVNVALAVWQAAGGERAGLKAFSPEWVTASLQG